jgi:DNA-binding transcriptional LysR family regulator
MDFRTLRTFVEVVRQCGFSQAAKVVFTTQSTADLCNLLWLYWR